MHTFGKQISYWTNIFLQLPKIDCYFLLINCFPHFVFSRMSSQNVTETVIISYNLRIIHSFLEGLFSLCDYQSCDGFDVNASNTT